MRGTDIGLLIKRLLNDIEGIGHQVFPVVAEHGAKSPFIVYSRQSLTADYNKDGLIEESVTAGIDIVSTKYAESVEIAGKVRDILDSYRDSDIFSTQIGTASETYSDNYGFVQQLTYNFEINVTGNH